MGISDCSETAEPFPINYSNESIEQGKGFLIIIRTGSIILFSNGNESNAAEKFKIHRQTQKERLIFHHTIMKRWIRAVSTRP